MQYIAAFLNRPLENSAFFEFFSNSFFNPLAVILLGEPFEKENQNQSRKKSKQKDEGRTVRLRFQHERGGLLRQLLVCLAVLSGGIKTMNVIIYSTPTCHFCHLAKDFFVKNKVTFTDYNVAEDQEKAAEMIKKSGQMGVPVIDIDGQLIIGFDQPALKQALHLK